MQIIQYQLMTEVNLGTAEEPEIRQHFAAVTMPYTEDNLALAKREAWGGEISVAEGTLPGLTPAQEGVRT